MMDEDRYGIVLERVGNQPLLTMKILCQELGLELAEANSRVNNTPTTVASGLASAKALELKKRLDEIGNSISIPGMKIEAIPAKEDVKLTESATFDDAFTAIFGDFSTKD